MEIEYKFNCNECRKPDKDFPELFGDYECREEIYNCPKTTEHKWARFDAYGIYTELCCDECYENGNYSYRKDRYPTMENDGYGERLEPEE